MHSVEFIATSFVSQDIMKLIFIWLPTYVCCMCVILTSIPRSKEQILTNGLLVWLQLYLPFSNNGHFCKSPLRLMHYRLLLWPYPKSQTPIRSREPIPGFYQLSVFSSLPLSRPTHTHCRSAALTATGHWSAHSVGVCVFIQDCWKRSSDSRIFLLFARQTNHQCRPRQQKHRRGKKNPI